MPTYAEQFCLLTVDPVTGRGFPIPEQVRQLTLAGALLFDASFTGLINDDWEQLTVRKTAETGDPALDEALRCLLVVERSIPLPKALALVAAHGATLQRLVVESLQSRGLLVRRKSAPPVRARQPEWGTPDISLVVAMQQKIRRAIVQDEIPDFQVPPLLSLMVAGGLTRFVIKPEESRQFSEKIAWLAQMESLGREIIRAVAALSSADLEHEAASLIGLAHDEPRTFAGGMDAVLTALSHLYKEAGLNRSRKLIRHFNQPGGFACPGCAWPNPDTGRSSFAFCENGAKNVSAEATTLRLSAEFFARWSVPELLLTPEYWLEQQGRLTEPMILEAGATHYRPITWEQAGQVVAQELRALEHPDEAVFYASGRTSNEAAFLYQLFARAVGTNNLPTSANLCHEPSGKALTQSLGFGKSSVTLDDFPQADALFIFGHNPGSNHPRMLTALQEAVRRGCQIVAINPLPEASLLGFADPQEVGSYFGKQTALAQLHLQPKINGDMALVRGMAKAILEDDARTGRVLDTAFIEQHTRGFAEYRQQVEATPWAELVAASGVEQSQIVAAARIYGGAGKVIASWCLGIVHHRNAIATIREIVNLLLLRGHIGRPGAGVCPVRGHSNVQGMRTAGAGENMPEAFLDAVEKHFAFAVPRTPGLSVIPAIKAMAAGRIKVLLSLGGNLVSAVPDTLAVEPAVRQCRLTVMISTKLNRSHLVTGQRALLLPCLARSEEDIRGGTRQLVSLEDATGKIGFSQGCLPPASPQLKSEVAIIAGLAAATLGDRAGFAWSQWAQDNQAIRATMSQVIPSLRALADHAVRQEEYYLENPLRQRVFPTDDGRAHFSAAPLEWVTPAPGELLLMTIRSHDQFNTSIFGLNDRYRGIRNERRVLFMHRADMAERQIAPEQIVEIASHYDDQVRQLEGYYAIPYPLSRGSVAAYFPEANPLLSLNNVSETCATPAYKSVSVQVRPATGSGGRRLA